MIYNNIGRGYYITLLPVGEDVSRILLAGVQCNGRESRLADCPSEGESYAMTRCSHVEDVRLVCIPEDTPPGETEHLAQRTYVTFKSFSECEDGSLRLVDGTSAFNGRLEICQANVWGTICSYQWDTNDTIVACRQLGINATS